MRIGQVIGRRTALAVQYGVIRQVDIGVVADLRDVISTGTTTASVRAGINGTFNGLSTWAPKQELHEHGP